MARYDCIAVYILTNKLNGTLCIGVTSDLLARITDHRNERFVGFAKKYGCKTLVYWEQHGEIGDAIKREKQLKAWERKWKLALIEKDNPDWRDLYEDFILAKELRRPDLWPD